MDFEERDITTQPGAFVVIEGVDGAGKTSIAQKLLQDLKTLEQPEFNGALYVKEPGSTDYGQSIREAFLHQVDPLDPMTEVLGLLSAKNELISKVIRPAVKKGWIVVADRFTRSLMAYQGGIRGIPYATIQAILDASNLLIPPHIEIFLEVDEETQKTRRDVNLNVLDEAAALHSRELRAGFQEALNYLPPYRTFTVDANRSFDAVYEDVWNTVKNALKFHRITGQTMPEPYHGPLVNSRVSMGRLEELERDMSDTV